MANADNPSVKQLQTEPTIGSQLKQYRMENNLTVEKTALLLGVAVSTVYRIENDLVEPNDRNAYRIRKLPGFDQTT